MAGKCVVELGEAYVLDIVDGNRTVGAQGASEWISVLAEQVGVFKVPDFVDCFFLELREFSFEETV